MAGATGLELAASCVTGRRSNQLNYAPAYENRRSLIIVLPVLSTSANFLPVPSNTLKCRDRATTTCNLLDFNGTDSPFLIL